MKVDPYSGRSLSLLRDGAQVRRLRGEGFDVVVVPQIADVAGHHAKLYRAAAAIGAKGFVVRPPASRP